MMERAGETIIVADHRKIGYESFSFVSNLSAVAFLVTDIDEDLKPAITDIENAGPRIITVDKL
jgi:DeoR/GlpR family transcriptional regulator of sugar metabolism